MKDLKTELLQMKRNQTIKLTEINKRNKTRQNTRLFTKYLMDGHYLFGHFTRTATMSR